MSTSERERDPEPTETLSERANEGYERAEQLGHYRIVKELGRGGQGTVFLATDQRLGRDVALKLLTVALGAIPAERLLRFRREAEAASKLDHANICPVHDAGELEGRPFIAMRYVEGETLARRIEKARRPRDGSSDVTTRKGVTDTIALIEKVARALHYSHERGLIHRDVKPGNVMVTADGEPVVLDFGLARDELADEQQLTHSGDLLGTPLYMSPEQLLAQRIPLDRRTDVYSLGATLYECLTLRRPFEAPTRAELYKRIISSEPPSASGLNRQIPRDLQVVIQTAMEKDRDRRYQTALDLAEDLRRVRSFEPIRARPIGKLLRMKRWGQRHPVMTMAALGVLVALALTSGLLVRQTGILRRTKALMIANYSARAAETDDMLALALAVEAYELHPSVETLSQVHSTLAHARLRLCVPHDEKVTDAHWVPGSGGIATASADTVKVFGLDGGMQKAFTHPAGLTFTKLALSPQGRRMVAGDSGGGLWQGALVGSELERFDTESHGEQIEHVEWSSDGTRLATSSVNGRVCLWDAGSLQRLALLTDVGGDFASFSIDGKRLLTCGRRSDSGLLETPGGGPTLRVWRVVDLEQGRSEPILRPEAIDWVPGNDGFFSPDGTLIASLAASSLVLWSAEDGTLMDRHWGAQGSLEAGHWYRPDLLLTAGWDMKAHLRRIDLRPGSRALLGSDALATFHGHAGPILSIRASEDGAAVLTGGGRTARVWDIHVPEVPVLLQSDARSVGFSKDGEFMLTTAPDVCKLWSHDGRLLASHENGESEPGIRDASFAPSGRQLVVFSQGKSSGWILRRFAVERRGSGIALVEQQELRADTGARNTGWAKFVDEERVLASAGSEVVLWHPETNRVDRFDAGALVNVGAIDVEHGRFVVSTQAGTVLVWSLDDPEPERKYQFERNNVSVSLSPDGHSLLVNPEKDSIPHEAVLIDLETGARTRRYGPHDGVVTSCEFAPDGRRIVTTSRDGKARLWSIDGTLEAVLDPESGITFMATFSPDGSRILTSSFASARVWIADPEELLSVARSRLTDLKAMLSESEWQTYLELVE